MSAASPPTQRRASSLARDANTRAGANPSASRFGSVDINPQLCVLRSFADLESTVRAVRAGPLPPRCTVYSSGRSATDAGAADAPAPRVTSPPCVVPASGSASLSTTTVSGGAAVRPAEAPSLSPCPTSLDSPSTVTLASPVAPSAPSSRMEVPGPPTGAGAESGTGPLRMSAPFPASATVDGAAPPLGHAASPTAPGAWPHARKMLCIWDVDDTLVASGAAGTRQTMVFPAADLLPLFKTLRGARHLLLSQGSVDDVFYPNSGRLRFLEKYFASATLPSKSGSDSNKDKSPGTGGGFFSCGGTKERTPQKPDITSFEPGTALIRLSTVSGCEEESSDTDFLYDPKAKPKLRGDTKYDQIRWLVLRPCTWGITLATLNSLIAPSERTACVDGKVFHKVDVVWSLARSGLWDAVFFVDNNLTEIGVVKYGMNLENLFKLRQTQRMHKFFHAEFLLLAASAKLRELEKQHGRDVTLPPQDRASQANGAGPGGGRVVQDEAAALREARLLKTLTTAVTNDCRAPYGANGSWLSRSTTESFELEAAGAAGEPTGFVQRRSSPVSSVGRCRRVDLVVAHLHLSSDVYRRLILRNRSGTPIGTRNSDVSRCSGQPTFIGDSSLTDEQYDALLALFRTEESSMYQLMDEDMRINGFVETGTSRKWRPMTRHVHMTIFRRPATVPHMRTYYESIAAEVEERVVVPLLRGAGSIKGAAIIRSDAHMLCTRLLRAGPFLDPRTQGELAQELYLVYTAEGNVPKASGECVRRAVAKLISDPKQKASRKHSHSS